MFAHYAKQFNFAHFCFRFIEVLSRSFQTTNSTVAERSSASTRSYYSHSSSQSAPSESSQSRNNKTHLQPPSACVTKSSSRLKRISNRLSRISETSGVRHTEGNELIVDDKKTREAQAYLFVLDQIHSNMSGVRDPAFWKRFSVAVHEMDDVEARPEMKRGYVFLFLSTFVNRKINNVDVHKTEILGSRKNDARAGDTLACATPSGSCSQDLSRGSSLR